MKKLRLFKCQECGEQAERFVKDEVQTVKCECLAIMTRQVSAAKYFGNTVGKSPSF
jgi:hypothetical protein